MSRKGAPRIMPRKFPARLTPHQKATQRKHHTKVAELDERNPNAPALIWWQAQCSCGWHGEGRPVHTHAQNDAAIHSTMSAYPHINA